MSKKNKNQKEITTTPIVDNTNNIVEPIIKSTTTTKAISSNKNTGNKTFMFTKKNYQIMLIGLAIIILGFILMSGGKSADPHVFNYNEIYSFRRITLAPILVMLGFLVEMYAILYVPKTTEEN